MFRDSVLAPARGLGIRIPGTGVVPTPPTPVTFGAHIDSARLDTSGNPLVMNTDNPAPAGKTLCIYFDTHSALEPAAISDGSGLSIPWQLTPSMNQGGRKLLYFAHLAATVPAGTNITLTSGQPGRHAAIAFTVNGIIGGGLDVRGAAGASGTGLAPTITSPALVAGKEKIVIGIIELGAGGLASDINEAAGWTTIAGTGNTLWYLHMAYKIVSAAETAAQTYAPTLNVSRAWMADIISLKAA